VTPARAVAAARAGARMKIRRRVQRAGNFVAGSGDSTAIIMQLKTCSLTFTLLLLGACPGETGKGTDSSSDPTTSSSTTDDMPTTNPSSTTDESGTTDEAPTTEDSATVGTSGEDTTTTDTDTGVGPVDPELESACRAACEREIECEEEAADVEECVVGCSEEFAGLPAECDPLTLDFLLCMSQASCLDLEGNIEEGVCADAFDAFEECADVGPGACVTGLSEGEEECGVSTECPDEPRREIVCDTQTCTCFEGDVEVASCPAEGVCLQGDAIFDKRDSCCNFE
jgi:hypothetical protein